jgi:hypothetical protein
MAKDEKDQTKAEPEEVQRWTAKRRTALAVSIIKGETSPQEAARKHGLTVAEVEEWRERFLPQQRMLVAFFSGFSNGVPADGVGSPFLVWPNHPLRLPCRDAARAGGCEMSCARTSHGVVAASLFRGLGLRVGWGPRAALGER